MRIKYFSLIVIFIGFMTSCSAPEGIVSMDPDMQFGHRYEDVAPDGYSTITIQPPDETLRFTYFSATFDRVIVRSDMALLEHDPVEVEILIKGRLPDACMELHAFNQKRTGNIITATLMMRRLESHACATVRRPYRLYLMLEDKYELGSYTLKLNNTAVPFVVQQAEGDM